ncbi:hypothetical protein FN846DRAFT_447946 [Sphaerosporella brunnea]|uniref:Uncharacterized protein n=1 Tax=Sphaerosporella brunnea TaxID=1250544 RepID=A0A5J5F4B8_9PEZI|nr:hypothetical protein FN846DRAFT_447946 [Sphaerosporella brunnea]
MSGGGRRYTVRIVCAISGSARVRIVDRRSSTHATFCVFTIHLFVSIHLHFGFDLINFNNKFFNRTAVSHATSALTIHKNKLSVSTKVVGAAMASWDCWYPDEPSLISFKGRVRVRNTLAACRIPSFEHCIGISLAERRNTSPTGNSSKCQATAHLYSRFLLERSVWFKVFLHIVVLEIVNEDGGFNLQRGVGGPVWLSARPAALHSQI